MISRRKLLSALSATGLGVGLMRSASAQHEQHQAAPAAAAAPSPSAAPAAGAYTPVRTPNGWTLPHRLKDGVKEFHLVAEEIEHEFAPGSKAKCWGYNGSTPGPTLEAVEGDRVRIYVTNRLGEATSVHWHGILLPSGMDGVGGLSQRHIQPGETYVYEFTLNQHGTHMYHPHADEMTQLGLGMMGFFIIHPKAGEIERIDRDYAIMLHNWALHPGTSRPDPSIMSEFDLWTFNSKVFPATESLVAASGERVRIRFANVSMWNHPIHLHGHRFEVTGGDSGRWPRTQWRREVTEIIAVGQTRDLEFTAVPGDWALHCHMSHHTMNAMGHGIPNPIGVDQRGVAEQVRELLPGYMAMGEHGMSEHGEHVAMGMLPGPDNTLPMASGEGPYGPLEMGGMFTVVKVRENLARGDYRDPGWYRSRPAETARRVSSEPDFGKPYRRARAGA
ncbi:Multicopper oxidase [Solimonas aquatica]|uniref:Multicopper oxidase n=1 Tax=Solimonas aquatica TaxID=489703 RepID=A0A1H9LT19_9GAMM|nr:copper oxidase [Solimonas aquatica]SER14419.1 Multicopper oxidase [Solimonas aquatica]